MTSRIQYRGPVAGLILLFNTVSSCPVADAQISPFQDAWQVFDATNGLPFSSALSVFQDASEAIWIGTPRGVVRYDGLRSTLYDRGSGLMNEYVRAITQDPSGSLWFGTDAGVFVLTPGSGAALRAGLEGRQVTGILSDRTGALWTFADGSVFSKPWGDTLWVLRGIATIYGNALSADSSGRVWIGGDDGIRVFDPTFGQWIPTPPAMQGLAYISALFCDTRGRMWMTGDDLTRGVGGVMRFDPTNGTLETMAPWISNIRSLLVDRFGYIWAGTEDEVRRYDGARWEVLELTFSAQDPVIRNLIEDRSGNIWCANDAFGAVRFHHSRDWLLLTGPNPLRVHVDERDTIWTDSGGLSRFRGFGYGWEQLLCAPETAPITESQDGILRYGLQRVVGDSCSVPSWALGLGRPWAAVSRGLTGWFACDSGVAVLRRDSILLTPLPPSVPGELIRAIAVDSLDIVWLGTTVGLWSREGDTGEWREISIPGCTSTTSILCLLATSTGVWVGGSCRDNSNFGPVGLLAIWDGVSLSSVGARLGTREIVGLAEERPGVVWAAFNDWATVRGFLRFDHGTFSVVSREFHESRDAFRDHRGVLWFAGEGGVLRLIPDFVAPQTLFLDDKLPPAIAGRSVNVAATAAFGESNDLEFQFSMDADSSSWLRVPAWSDSGLTDGHHSLTVRARDSNGNVDPTPARWEFEVDATPPRPRCVPVDRIAPDSVVVRGNTMDDKFYRLRVRVRLLEGPPGIACSDPEITIADSTAPVVDGVLAIWRNTRACPDGLYEIEVEVTDRLGLAGSAILQVVVDYREPKDQETSPVRIGQGGGNVYSIDGKAHVYIPPGMFDGTVRLTPLLPDSACGPGAYASYSAVSIQLDGDVGGNKYAVLDLTVPGDPVGGLAIARCAVGNWTLLGGRQGPGRDVVTIPFRETGVYALVQGVIEPRTSSTILDLQVAPRVIGRSGSPNSSAAIGFRLERPGPISLVVYGRSGRRIRTLLDGAIFPTGVHAVWWDGTDDSRARVPPDLYLITVQSRDDRATKTIAVGP